MLQPRVTLAQIAKRAGVHITTVSLALRDSPRLPADTRARLQTLAREMGYAPDPALSALNAYRKGVKTPAFQGTIAWLNNFPEADNWSRFFCFRDYFAGATARAAEYGFKVEEFRLADTRAGSARLATILESRGIGGLFVGPQPRAESTLEFTWEKFSAVTFGNSLVHPQLHRVTNHQFRSMLILLRALRGLGYRRIGLYAVPVDDTRVNHQWSAAYQTYDRHLPRAERVPICWQAHLDDAPHFNAWVKSAAPEIVVTQNCNVWDWLLATGQKVPESVGMALLCVGGEEKLLSGIHQNDRLIGAAAFDLLLGMLHRHERGPPAVAQHVLIDGVFREGTTVRRVGPPADWFGDHIAAPLGWKTPTA